MQNATGDDILRQRTIDLCQAILDQPNFQSIRQRIDAFQGDVQAQDLYRVLNENREALEEKQRNGQTLTDEDIAGFEKRRDAFLANGVAMAFVDAQQTIQRVRSSVGQYVTRTFELGRVPTEDDLKCESCNHKHGCH